MATSLATAILNLLREADRPLSVYEITDHLSSDDLRIPVRVISQCLQNDLSPFVREKNLKWHIVTMPASDEKRSRRMSTSSPSNRTLAKDGSAKHDRLLQATREVLERARSPLSLSDLVKRISNTKVRHPDARLILQSLINGDIEGVVQDENRCWMLQRHTGSDSANAAEQKRQDHEVRQPDPRDIKKYVLHILRRSSNPLTITQIHERLEETGISISAGELEKYLHQQLRDRLEQDKHFRWLLRQPSSTSESQASSSNGTLDTPMSTTVSDKGYAYHNVYRAQNDHAPTTDAVEKHPDLDERGTELSGSPAFMPAVQETLQRQKILFDFQHKVELARSVIVTLAVTRRPLAIKDIVWVLGEIGKSVRSDDVSSCIKTVLSSYVERDEDGKYQLRLESSMFEDEHVSTKPGGELSTSILENIALAAGDLDTPAFFAFRKDSATQSTILLNSSHPAFEWLQKLVKQPNVKDPDLAAHWSQAREALHLLLAAWMTYEDDLQGVRREKAQEARTDWGRVARRMTNLDNDTH